MWNMCIWIYVLLHFLIRTGSESQKSVIKCDTRKTLLLLDGWMDLNQTSTQCSPTGGAGIWVVLSFWIQIRIRIWWQKMCDTLKMLFLLDGLMDLNQSWTQCSPSGGHLGCPQFLDPDQDPDMMTKNVWYMQNATPRGLDGFEPNLDTMFPHWGGKWVVLCVRIRTLWSQMSFMWRVTVVFSSCYIKRFLHAALEQRNIRCSYNECSNQKSPIFLLVVVL